MDREIEHHLREWQGHPRQMPLLVRGARQVGKTYIIEKFGRENFESLVTVNFERTPAFRRAFEDFDPRKIVSQLETLCGQKIVPGSTLLFLDEIQACPRAITALRYFKEEMPQLHVVAAGSLLEFAIDKEQISFPVGRLQYLYMHPLSFREFLRALGEDPLIEHLGQVTVNSPPGGAVHEHALKLVRQYLLVGGMPAAVTAYRESGSMEESWRIQQGLMQTYRDDFGKYANQTQHDLLQLLLEQAPLLIGRHFQYSKIDPGVRSRELKAALNNLCHAGLTFRVHKTAANGIPLRAEVNSRKFKLLFLDVGLLQRAFHIDPQHVFDQDLLQVNSGQLAEQFVGQELLSGNSPYEERHLYFWERAKRSSSAEVDYVVRVGAQVIPIEVKAGVTGRLKSLKTFIKEKGIPRGVRISQCPLELEGNILSVPLYLIHHLPRLLS